MPRISGRAQGLRDLVVGLVRTVVKLKENDAAQQAQINALTGQIAGLCAALSDRSKSLTREAREQGPRRSLKVVTDQAGYKSSAIWRYLRNKDIKEFGRCEWYIIVDGHHVEIDTDCPSFPEKAKRLLREFEERELMLAEKEEKTAK